MIRAANEAMEAATSVAGIRFYVREILRRYTTIVRYRPRRAARSVRFGCDAPSQFVQCREPVTWTLLNVSGVRCQYLVDGKAFDTLHEAAASLESPGGAPPADAAQEEMSSPRATDAYARQVLCAGGGRTDLRKRGYQYHKPKWCYEINDRSMCRSSQIPPYPGDRCAAQRPCVWHEDLAALRSTHARELAACSSQHPSLGPRNVLSACLSVCCPSFCGPGNASR